MQCVLAAVAALLIAGTLGGQQTSGYPPGDNPFQAEYDFALGQPVQLHVDVQGVRFDALTVVALEAVKSGAKTRCEVQVTGTNAAEKRATVTTVLLLEDASGKGLDRLTLEAFKVKPAKPIEEKQRLTVAADSLSSATKVYVFVQVSF
ncbi:MAG: hypothetical protein ACHQQS_10860 [Thermoanaerobaculales bacterium]